MRKFCLVTEGIRPSIRETPKTVLSRPPANVNLPPSFFKWRLLVILKHVALDRSCHKFAKSRDEEPSEESLTHRVTMTLHNSPNCGIFRIPIIRHAIAIDDESPGSLWRYLAVFVIFLKFCRTAIYLPLSTRSFALYRTARTEKE